MTYGPIEARAGAYRAVLRALTANLSKLEVDGRFPLPVHVNPPSQKWFLDNPDGVTLRCPAAAYPDACIVQTHRDERTEPYREAFGA